MRTKVSLALFLSGTALVAGCTTPFSQDVQAMDWSARPGPGTIMVSDPKMYRREALINERNADAAWIDTQIEASKTIEFKPEVTREVEQITALAAAVGLSFDPGAGANYRRASETSDLQQQIDVMRLQLQLDQLKRDAELVRSKFEAQTEPVNAGVGTLGSGTATPLSSTAQAAAADQLKASIDKLNTTLATRLDAEGKPAAVANSNVNPADVFRDREAYRDLLKSARNAVSLDELQDYKGTALLRLNFEATVLPDSRHLRAPGIIQMTVVPPAFTTAEKERLYLGWLNYMNDRLNVEGAGGGLVPDTVLLGSAVAENFDTAQYSYAPPAAAGLTCPGLLLSGASTAPPGCATLILAVPKFTGEGPQEGAYSSLEQYLGFFDPGLDEATDRAHDQAARELIRGYAKAIAPDCGLPQPSADPAGPGPRLYDAIATARLRVAGSHAFGRADWAARRLLQRYGLSGRASERLPLIALRTARAQLLLASFSNQAYEGCPIEARENFAAWAAAPVFVPPGFSSTLAQAMDRVAVYEVGPRDQVQQVSTVARDAASLALAVSIAASKPGSGMAANAAGSYSRQVMGRAAMLERVPAVVGYSPGGTTFGWVLGPKATLDPKGRIELRHGLEPYDLSVDLSVPSWWPSFGLQVATSWAPPPASITQGSVAAWAPAVLKTVPLPQNDGDFATLTSRIAYGGLDEARRLTLDQPYLSGQAVSACRPVTLSITGENLWRASVAIIAGQRLGADAISVAPNMAGILLDVPALGDTLGDTPSGVLPVRIMTSLGQAVVRVDYIPKSAAGCAGADKKNAAATDGPAVSSVEPTQFAVPAAITFRVTGAKLDEIDRVTLNGQAGALKAAKDGKSIEVSFTSDLTANLPVSRTVQLSFYKGDAKVDTKLVEVAQNGKGS